MEANACDVAALVGLACAEVCKKHDQTNKALGTVCGGQRMPNQSGMHMKQRCSWQSVFQSRQRLMQVSFGCSRICLLGGFVKSRRRLSLTTALQCAS